MDYFTQSRQRASSGVNSVDRNRLNAPLPPNPQTPGTPGLRPQSSQGRATLEGLRAPSSIRIRRLPSSNNVTRIASQQRAPSPAISDGASTGASTGRRRSSSEPQRFGANLNLPGISLGRQRTVDEPRMTTVSEEVPARPNGATQRVPSDASLSFREAPETPFPETPYPDDADAATLDPASRVVTGASAMHAAGNAARQKRGLSRTRTAASNADRGGQLPDNEYQSDVVDLLDLVDPEVQMLGTLTNVQNSLFVPDLGRLINRRPTYTLTQRPTNTTTGYEAPSARRRAGTGATRPPADLATIPQAPSQDLEAQTGAFELQPSRERRFSISSDLSDSRYAVLPHGISLEDWTEEDKAELDDYVRHLMHSRREGFKRSMKGFGKYISKPMGLFVVVYAVLVTLFGAAWVFFLIGWIYVGNREQYIINIVDNVLVALFALIGDGLAPFRAVDTYHMCFIAHYHHLTWRLRKEKNLPELLDHNDLPLRRPEGGMAVEDAIDKEENAEFSVLSPLQQRRLQYHQAKFNKAHTFYRPHETSTHHAFPLNLLVAVVVLLDCHSMFQIALGTCTWSINYHVRPEALTATILSLSISCNITAGILISVGDHRTRKKDVLERAARQTLTEEALNRMAKNRGSEERIARMSEEVSRVAAAKEKEEEVPPMPTTRPDVVVSSPA